MKEFYLELTNNLLRLAVEDYQPLDNTYPLIANEQNSIGNRLRYHNFRSDVTQFYQIRCSQSICARSGVSERANNTNIVSCASVPRYKSEG